MGRVHAKLQDYLRMGVEHVWLIDPWERGCWICTLDGMHSPSGNLLVVPGTDVSLPMDEIFGALD